MATRTVIMINLVLNCAITFVVGHYINDKCRIGVSGNLQFEDSKRNIKDAESIPPPKKYVPNSNTDKISKKTSVQDAVEIRRSLVSKVPLENPTEDHGNPNLEDPDILNDTQSRIRSNTLESGNDDGETVPEKSLGEPTSHDDSKYVVLDADEPEAAEARLRNGNNDQQYIHDSREPESLDKNIQTNDKIEIATPLPSNPPVSDAPGDTVDTDQSNSDTDSIEPDKRTEEIPSFHEWKQRKLDEDKLLIKQAAEAGSGELKQVAPVTVRSIKINLNNFGSNECGAKILAFNEEAQNAHKVLNENKDSYMLNPCTARAWFEIELCEPIQIKQVDLANFELFSSVPKTFMVSVSERYPTRDWKELSTFQAKDERVVQSFTVDSTLFVKYIRIDMLGHYGNEHYCPLSLIRVFGITMVEEDEDDRSQEHLHTAVEVEQHPDPVIKEESIPTFLHCAKDVLKSVLRKTKQFFVGGLEDITTTDLAESPSSNGTTNQLLPAKPVVTGPHMQYRVDTTGPDSADMQPTIPNAAAISEMPEEVAAVSLKRLEDEMLMRECNEDMNLDFLTSNKKSCVISKVCYFFNVIRLINSEFCKCFIQLPAVDKNVPVVSIDVTNNGIKHEAVVDSTKSQQTALNMAGETSDSPQHNGGDLPATGSSLGVQETDDAENEKVRNDNINGKETSPDALKSTPPLSCNNDKKGDSNCLKTVVDRTDEGGKTRPNSGNSKPQVENHVDDKRKLAEDAASPIINGGTNTNKNSDNNLSKGNGHQPVKETSNTISNDKDGNSNAPKAAESSGNPVKDSNYTATATDMESSNGSNPNGLLLANVPTNANQKETIIMRLKNKVKDLEINQTLSTMYSEDVRQRYIKLIEDLQRGLNGTRQQLESSVALSNSRELVLNQKINDLQDMVLRVNTVTSELEDQFEIKLRMVYVCMVLVVSAQMIIGVCIIILCLRRHSAGHTKVSHKKDEVGKYKKLSHGLNVMRNSSIDGFSNFSDCLLENNTRKDNLSMDDLRTKVAGSCHTDDTVNKAGLLFSSAKKPSKKKRKQSKLSSMPDQWVERPQKVPKQSHLQYTNGYNRDYSGSNTTSANNIASGLHTYNPSIGGKSKSLDVGYFLNKLGIEYIKKSKHI